MCMINASAKNIWSEEYDTEKYCYGNGVLRMINKSSNNKNNGLDKCICKKIYEMKNSTLKNIVSKMEMVFLGW